MEKMTVYKSRNKLKTNVCQSVHLHHDHQHLMLDTDIEATPNQQSNITIRSGMETVKHSNHEQKECFSENYGYTYNLYDLELCKLPQESTIQPLWFRNYHDADGTGNVSRLSITSTMTETNENNLLQESSSVDQTQEYLNDNLPSVSQLQPLPLTNLENTSDFDELLQLQQQIYHTTNHKCTNKDTHALKIEADPLSKTSVNEQYHVLPITSEVDICTLGAYIEQRSKSWHCNNAYGTNTAHESKEQTFHLPKKCLNQHLDDGFEGLVSNEQYGICTKSSQHNEQASRIVATNEYIKYQGINLPMNPPPAMNYTGKAIISTPTSNSNNICSSPISKILKMPTIPEGDSSSFPRSIQTVNESTSPTKPSLLVTRNRSAAAKLARFPNLLYRLLMDADTQRFSNIVSWLPHGRAFVIRDVRSFESFVMLRYFSNSNWNSFRR